MTVQGYTAISFFFFNFIFKLYIIVLVLPNIKMNPPQVYMCSPFLYAWAVFPIFGGKKILYSPAFLCKGKLSGLHFSFSSSRAHKHPDFLRKGTYEPSNLARSCALSLKQDDFHVSSSYHQGGVIKHYFCS